MDSTVLSFPASSFYSGHIQTLYGGTLNGLPIINVGHTVETGLYAATKIPSDWCEHRQLVPLVHWCNNHGASGSVVWALEYQLAASPLESYRDTETIVAKSTCNSGSARQVTVLPSISMAGMEARGMFIGRLYRVTGSTEDTAEDSVALIEFSLHED